LRRISERASESVYTKTVDTTKVVGDRISEKAKATNALAMVTSTWAIT